MIIFGRMMKLLHTKVNLCYQLSCPRHYSKQAELLKFERLFQNARCRQQNLPTIIQLQEKFSTLWQGKSLEEQFVLKRQLDRVIYLYNLIGSTTFRVPSVINQEQMRQLIELTSSHDQKKLIIKLYTNEFIRWKKKEFDRKMRAEFIQKKLEERYNQLETSSRIGIFNDNNELIYGLWHNTIFSRIKSRQVRELVARKRLKEAAMFGPKLVIDFQNEASANLTKVKDAAFHLNNLVTKNRYSKLNVAFDLHFCNLEDNSRFVDIMDRYIKIINSKNALVNCTQQTYLNLFPLDKIIYVNPQAYQLLGDEDMDLDRVFVLNAFPDNDDLMKVTGEGIKARRIPVNDYLDLKVERLNLEIEYEILANFITIGSIEHSIRLAVPKRLVKSADVVAKEDEKRVKELIRQRKQRKSQLEGEEEFDETSFFFDQIKRES